MPGKQRDQNFETYTYTYTYIEYIELYTAELYKE